MFHIDGIYSHYVQMKQNTLQNAKYLIYPVPPKET